jgi:hypothetical protein
MTLAKGPGAKIFSALMGINHISGEYIIKVLDTPFPEIRTFIENVILCRGHNGNTLEGRRKSRVIKEFKVSKRTCPLVFSRPDLEGGEKWTFARKRSYLGL